jgi:hypothetical protein
MEQVTASTRATRVLEPRSPISLSWPASALQEHHAPRLIAGGTTKLLEEGGRQIKAAGLEEEAEEEEKMPSRWDVTTRRGRPPRSAGRADALAGWLVELRNEDSI